MLETFSILMGGAKNPKLGGGKGQGKNFPCVWAKCWLLFSHVHQKYVLGSRSRAPGQGAKPPEAETQLAFW